MISRFTRNQLIAFLAVSVLGITFTGVEYVRLPRLLGFGQYELTMNLAETDGLYANSPVTYRGNEIGKVRSIALTPSGVQALLSIDDDVQLPADSKIEVRSTSAIGEQYVDFSPQHGAARLLRPGDVIAASQVKLPTDVAALLGSVNGLVNSVPRNQLNTTINELYNAFNGSTDDVHKIFDSAQLLLESANANFDPTTQLLRQLVPVLATQEHTAPEIVSAYHDLASFTDQIAASDADIRGDLDKAPGFAHEFEALFNQLRPTLPILLNNINNVSKVTTTYLPQLQQTLVIAPVIVNQVSSIYLTNPIPNVLGFDFKLTANNPPVCTKGFVQVHRDPNDISAAAPPVDTYCKTPHDSPLSIRGNKNDPCPAGSRVPRANSAANCGFDFQAPSEAKRATDAGIETLIQAYNDSLKRPGKIIGTNECEGNDPPGSLSGRNSGEGKSTFPGPSGCEGGPPIPLPPPSGATTYSPDTGLGVTPGGQPFVNGNGLPRPAGADGLGSFLSGPLGTPIP